MSDDHITHEAWIGLPPLAAFRLFTDGFGRWWPREYTWGGAACAEIGMEPGLGGACREIGPHGFRSDWGRITLWEPPHHLRFTWQIAPDRAPQPDPERASEVEVLFEAQGARTRLVLTHAGLARHGAGWEGVRDGMASAQGWPLLLGRYVGLAG